MKAHEYYSRAMLLASDKTMAARCQSMAQLATGWTVDLSPMAAHRCLAERLQSAEGKQINQSMALLLGKCNSSTALAGTAVYLSPGSRFTVTNKQPGTDNSIGVIQEPPEILTVEHARLWQYMSCRLISQPAGLLQFQMELAILLEELASPPKPRLQLVSA